MGQVYRIIDIGATLDHFNIATFIETGTGIGDSVKAVRESNSRTLIYTIELMPELFEPIYEAYKDDDWVEPLLGYSHEVLAKDILRDSLPSAPAFFWHDAHFPGADFKINGASYLSEPVKERRIPLEAEIEAIKDSGRDVSNDLFMMDDLRIYRDGPYVDGNWEWRRKAGDSNCDFVYDFWGPTHDLYVSYLDQGYIFGVPKGATGWEHLVTVEDFEPCVF